MANFLQVSEPEAAELDAQSSSIANTQRLKNQSANALVAQYGPAAADPEMYSQAVAANQAQQEGPLKVQAAQLGLQNAQQEHDRDAQLRAAYALQSAVNGGASATDAFDQIVAPNAATLGLSPDQAKQFRDHLGSTPDPKGTITSLITALSGPAKPLDASQMSQRILPDGSRVAGFYDERGQWHGATGTPDGSKPAGAVGGAVQYQQIGTQWYSSNDRGISWLPMSGAPMSAVNSQNASEVKAGVMPSFMTQPPTNQGDALKRAVIGQESGGNPGVGNSSAGAHGIGQIMPATFAKYAKPGESIDNPADNAAVSGRILDDYMQRYDDPARAAVAYFSGPANVAPAGSKTPWLKDAKDTDGTSTSQYVSGVLGRMGSGASAMPTQQLTPVAQIAQQRAATAAQRELRISQTSSAQVSPETVDYLAQRFRTTGNLPAMGMGGAALRAQVFSRAAEMAKADGSDGQSDAYMAQATKERGTAVNDLGRSTPGSAGGRIQSVNALVTHMDQLSTLGVQLTSGNLPLLNQARLAYQQATGSPAPTNFNAVRTIAANEAAKFLAGANYTEADRKQAQSMFDAAQSPAQLNGALSNVQRLVVGQVAGMRQRYDAIGATSDFDATLTPRVKQLAGIGAAPASAGWRVVGVQ